MVCLSITQIGSPSIDTRINPMMPLLNEMRHAQSTKTLKYHRSPGPYPSRAEKLVLSSVALLDVELNSPMASQKCKECILQIIDQLRQRKARPDIVRICHMAARKHGMKWQETESHLEKLVESGTVVKVDYKGNVSYRNTAKWKKTHSWKKVVHSDKTCKNIISAVQEIAQNSLERGASVKDVEKWLSTNTQGPQIERTQLRAALDKEVVNGNLKKLPQGTYISSESNPEKKITEKPTTSVSSPGKRGRPPSKRKVKDDTLPI